MVSLICLIICQEMKRLSAKDLLTFELLTTKDKDKKPPLWYAGDIQKETCAGFLTPFYETLTLYSDLKEKCKEEITKHERKVDARQFPLFESVRDIDDNTSYEEKRNKSLLTMMVEANCLKMMQHDYTQDYLKKCWRSYGRFFFYINFWIYLTFVTLMATYVASHKVTMDAENGRLVPHGEFNNDTAFNKSDLLNKTIAWGKSQNILYSQKISSRISNSEDICIAILALSSILFLWEGIQIVAKGKYYLNSWDNWADMLIFIGSIFLTSFSLVNGYTICEHGLWTVLAVLAWFKVAWLLTQIPKYTSENLEAMSLKFLMLFKVTFNVLKFLPVFLLFIGTFAFGFYCLFNQDDEFNQFEYSMLKTVALAIGEFEFRDLFLESQTSKFHYILGCIMVMLLFCVLTTSGMNLLVGLAVGEIKALEENSEVNAFLILTDQLFESRQIMVLFKRLFRHFGRFVDRFLECKFEIVMVVCIVGCIGGAVITLMIQSAK